MEIKISATLDEFESETLADMFMDRVSEHREMAIYNHGVGKITKAELDWHLKHADYVESIAKKIFPGWAGGK